MKSVIWNYKDKKLSRNEAIERIYELGFVDDKIRGWVKSLGTTQIHIIPSDGFMTIHRDNDLHTVMGGSKTRMLLLKTRAELDRDIKFLLLYKLKLFINVRLKKLLKSLYKKL